MDNPGDHTPKERLPLWTVKLFAALLMAAVCTAGCLLPVVVAAHAQKPPAQQQWLKRLKNSVMHSLLSLINCFAAGAFLGLAIIHLLPEAVLQLQRDAYLLVLRSKGGSGEEDSSHTYNIAYVLAAVGFTAMLALEQFLAGGHAHCHRGVPPALEGEADGEAAALALPSFGDLSRWCTSVESPGLLQHSSHHHAQHHLLCTSANYCPGCDDCAEAATAAPAAGGEASAARGAVSAAFRGRQLVTAYGGTESHVAGPAVRGVDLEDAGCGGVAAEKKHEALQLLRAVPAQREQGEDFGLYKEEERTHSRETANTSTSCADVIHEKGSAALLHPVQTVRQDRDSSTGSTTKKARLAVTADNTCFPAKEKLETGNFGAKNDDVCEKDFGSARAEPEVHSVPSAVGPAVAAAAAPASRPASAAVAGGKTVPQLLLGMYAGHETTNPAGNGVKSRNVEHATETMEERSSSSGSGSEWDLLREVDRTHAHNSNELCCKSELHSTEGENARLPTAPRESHRSSQAAGAAATPGATGGARSTAAHRCDCKDLEGSATITPCRCSGCCKECGDHSHDPESSSRVHSGSMGANVQGGDSAAEQQRGALNGNWRWTSGTTTGSSGDRRQEEGKGEEYGDNRKEGTEADFHMVSVTSPPATIQSVDPLSPRSNSVGCCGCCSRGETVRLPKNSLPKEQNMHLQRQQQNLPGRGQHQYTKARAAVTGAPDDGQHAHRRRIHTRGRILGWIGHFDAARWSLTVALSVHAIFEGVILGTTVKSEDVWIAALAILGHKAAEGVALSTTLLRLNLKKLHFHLVLGLFVMASPVGVFLGTVATIGGTGVCGIFNALAVGAVLYSTNEMLSEFAGRCSRVRRVLKLLSFILGLGMLFGLDLLHAPFCQQHHGGRRHFPHQHPH